MTFAPVPPQRRRPVMPPVIPEIAKAYQNDPRTQLSLSQLASGASTAPVAQEGWAWADGLARVLQGTAGGYFQKEMMRKYGEDEAELLDLRRKRGEEGLGIGRAAPVAAGPMNAGLAAFRQGALPPVAQGPAPAPQMPAPAPQAPQTLESQFDAAFAPAGASQAGAVASIFAPAPTASPAALQANGAAPLNPVLTQPIPARNTNPAGGPAQAAQGPFPGSAARTPPRTNAPRKPDYISYKSPDYEPLERKYEQEYNLPPGLLTGIRVRGEKTNANVTSPAGARTVYQFTPDTRRLFIRKYKVDPWASPEMAAKAAAIHLRESLDRNGGNVAAAVAEYHGGPDVRKHGPINRAYVARVVGDGSTGTSAPLAAVPVPQVEAFKAGPAPALPADVARPVKPEAEPATKSRTLEASYRMMVDGNRYESATAQDMNQKGLAEQSQFEDRAADRRQTLTQMGYEGDIQNYNTAQQQRRSFGFDTARDFQQDVFANRLLDRNKAYEAQAQARDHNQQRVLQNSDQQFGRWQTTYNNSQENFRQTRAFKHDKEMVPINTQAQMQLNAGKSEDRQRAFFSTPQGVKIFDAASQRIGERDGIIGKLSAFEQRLDAGAATGGFARANMPGFLRWSSSDMQELESISNDLTISLAGDLKGALSDSDRKFVEQVPPNIRKTGRANRADIVRLRATAERVQDFERSRLRAMGDGTGIDFMYQWGAYTKAVPIGGPSFDEWRNNTPRFDRNGRRVN